MSFLDLLKIEFMKVKRSKIVPLIFIAPLLVVVLEIYLLTTDYPYDSIYMLQHFMNNKFKSLDYQTLSAAAILMSLVMVVIIGLLFAVENHFGKDVEG